jgi:hypothetical protein
MSVTVTLAQLRDMLSSSKEILFGNTGTGLLLALVPISLTSSASACASPSSQFCRHADPVRLAANIAITRKLRMMTPGRFLQFVGY